MKAWVRVPYKRVGEPWTRRVPDFGRYSPNYSSVDLRDGTCLARIAGEAETVEAIKRLAHATELDDYSARALLRTIHPNSDLEDCDVPDPEVDALLKREGLDPAEVRRKARVTTKHALQSQELHALATLAERRGIDISDLREGCRSGLCAPHNQALSRVKP